MCSGDLTSTQVMPMSSFSPIRLERRSNIMAIMITSPSHQLYRHMDSCHTVITPSFPHIGRCPLPHSCWWLPILNSLVGRKLYWIIDIFCSISSLLRYWGLSHYWYIFVILIITETQGIAQYWFILCIFLITTVLQTDPLLLSLLRYCIMPHY